MAVYKVLQDIEGEDKLIAWLTPKQTIYAAIVVVCGILAYFMGRASIFLALPWIFPILAFGFLAAPLGRDQPNDVWLAAQIRFYIKNRKRVWDQTGMQELVHITVPKRVERIYTDGLNQSEVRSRLRALSATIDSRGWAVKNTTINMSVAPQFAAQFQQQQQFDDRLIGTDAMAHDVPISDVSASEDIMDAQNNSIAQRFDQQIKQQEELRKQALKEAMQNGTIAYQVPAQVMQQPQQQMPKDYYFMPQQQDVNKPKVIAGGEQTRYARVNNAVVPGQDVPEARIYTSSGDETDPNAQALLDKIRKDREFESQLETSQVHGKVVKTPAEVAAEERERALAAEAAAAEQRRLAAEEERRREEQAKRARMMATHTAPDAIIKELSRDSDLKVSTLASQAKHAAESNNDGEVVISLH